MLERTLLYTAMTRAKKLLILIGQKKALYMAIQNCSSHDRIGFLQQQIEITYDLKEVEMGALNPLWSKRSGEGMAMKLRLSKVRRMSDKAPLVSLQKGGNRAGKGSTGTAETRISMAM